MDTPDADIIKKYQEQFGFTEQKAIEFLKSVKKMALDISTMPVPNFEVIARAFGQAQIELDAWKKALGAMEIEFGKTRSNPGD